MISIFIFRAESAGWEEMDGLGGLTRFRQNGVFRGFYEVEGCFAHVGSEMTALLKLKASEERDYRPKLGHNKQFQFA